MSIVISKSGYYITVYIAVPGCPMLKEDSDESEKPSGYGHMWISLDNPSGLKESYGFHPKNPGEAHSDVGKVKPSDLHAYQQIDYQRSFPITENMYDSLHSYCQNALVNNTFGPYFGIGNACVDFAWDVMHAAGISKPFIARITPMEDWPASNEVLVEMAYASYICQVNYEVNDAEVV
jgi:hypothetical protein